jgi:hypothetical protein
MIAQHQAAQIICGSLRLAARGKERAAIGLQEANPGLDIAGMAQIAVYGEFSAEEGRAQLGNQFLGRIGTLAEAARSLTAAATLGFLSSPVIPGGLCSTRKRPQCRRRKFAPGSS